jgi:hypothetical protein
MTVWHGEGYRHSTALVKPHLHPQLTAQRRPRSRPPPPPRPPLRQALRFREAGCRAQQMGFKALGLKTWGSVGDAGR